MKFTKHIRFACFRQSANLDKSREELKRFEAVKATDSFKIHVRPKLPKYKIWSAGETFCLHTIQAITAKQLKKGVIKLSDWLF